MKGKDDKGPRGAFQRQKGDPRKQGGGVNEGMNLLWERGPLKEPRFRHYWDELSVWGMDCWPQGAQDKVGSMKQFSREQISCVIYPVAYPGEWAQALTIQYPDESIPYLICIWRQMSMRLRLWVSKVLLDANKSLPKLEANGGIHWLPVFLSLSGCVCGALGQWKGG